MTKNIGHIPVLDEWKSDTPSVLKEKEMFAGLVCRHKNPPDWQSKEYSAPS